MKGQEVPVCGANLEYGELAGRFRAVTGVKAVYRQCSVEEFAGRGGEGGARDERRGLGIWLEKAPDERTCYGTVEVGRLRDVERELGVKALSWEKFLERTRWRGPPR